jgi:CBS domain-containing protein
MTSRENNRQRGITGMLLFDRRNYLQLLEGVTDPVLSLFAVIKQDCRHAGIVKILQQPIVDRDFPDCAMEFRDLSPVGRDYPAGFGEFLEEHFDLGTLQPTGAAQLFGLFKKRSDTVAWSSGRDRIIGGTMSTRVVSELLASKNRQLFTILPEATVQEALEIMASKRISSLPVTRGAELVGILSERDYIRQSVPRRIAPWDVLVKDIMTADVICVTSDTPIRECMELMSSHRFRHLPVVDGKMLVGMLSISDIVRALQPARIDFPPD